jgi:amino acid adenylation domain-containing protein
MLNEGDIDILLFSTRFLKQKDYWRKKLSGEFEVIDIPLGYDKSQPGKMDSDRQIREIEIPFQEELGRRIIRLCRNSDLSIYILLLTALKSLIFRYTSNEDIIVLSPINKLKLEETEHPINDVLFIRDQVENTLSFKKLVLKVRESVLEAYENQDYPFDKLVEYLFPSSSGEQNKRVIPNILCSLGNLHDGINIKNIEPSLSFRFFKSNSGGQLNGHILYDANTYTANEVARVSNHFIHLLAKGVENVDGEISDISFLTEQEKEQLLKEFNCSRADFSRDRTIYQIVEDQVEKTPDAVAITFMDNDITYMELNNRAHRLAGCLRVSGVREDQTVGILLDRSPAMVESILAVWKGGGAYIPLDTTYPHQRILEILTDSHTRVLITRSEYVDPHLETAYPGKILTLDEQKGETFTDNRGSGLGINMSSLAYVIYTSGSTGKPKGAMVEHIGMMNHIGAKIHDLQLTSRSIVAQNASHTFDISVWQFFTALTLGGKTIVYPDELVLDTDQFISRIIEHQVTILEVVPSYLSVMLEFLDLNFRQLKYLDYLLVTGETVKPHLVNQWFGFYPGIRMVNAYGPTEASDDITHFVMDKTPDGDRIPIGKPIQNLNIYIVDEKMNLCPIGVKGEICVSGIGVGRGYINNLEKTREVFMDDPFLKESGLVIRLYKTGDLGRWTSDGNIDFFGRKDDQVKMRGFRIEPGEIENRLLNHDKIKQVVVIEREEKKGEKYLCAYIVSYSPEPLKTMELREFLLKELPDYMVPSYFVQLEYFPFTRSGKIDRKALPEPEIEGEEDSTYEAPANALEEKLAEIWSEILGIRKDSISTNANFFQLGGHSLMATRMTARIHKELNVRLPLREVFEAQTIKRLAEVIEGAAKDKYSSLETPEKKEYYPLSSAQKRLYVLHQMDEKNTRYSVPIILVLEGDVDKGRLEDTFRRLIKRHESLRTSFIMLENEPVQKIEQDIAFKVEYFKASEEKARDIVKAFMGFFDLTQAPLLKVGLIKTGHTRYVWMIDMHHIVSDGISTDIITRDFLAFYSGKELPLLKLQYKDFTEWQNGLLESGEMKKQEGYWLNRFRGDIPVLNMPLDYPRPPVYNAFGNCFNFSIDKAITTALKQLALEMETTLYIVLLTAYTVLLSKYSGQEDIVVGTPVAGRSHADLENIIGLFANMMAMRNQPRREKTFSQFLEDVKKNALDAYENQEYQFEQLVWNLNIKAEGSRHPLFDVVFVLQNTATDEFRINSKNQETLNKIKIFPYEHEIEKVQHELLLTVEEGGDTLSMSLEYAVELYKESTARNLSKHYVEILEQIAANRDITLKEIKISHDYIAAESDVGQDEAEDFRL